jgi:hypothetical protein
MLSITPHAKSAKPRRTTGRRAGVRAPSGAKCECSEHEKPSGFEGELQIIIPNFAFFAASRAISIVDSNTVSREEREAAKGRCISRTGISKLKWHDPVIIPGLCHYFATHKGQKSR